MLSDTQHSHSVLSAIKLSVVFYLLLLNVTMLSVILLNVMEPSKRNWCCNKRQFNKVFNSRNLEFWR
jgi:hypothetical protein